MPYCLREAVYKKTDTNTVYSLHASVSSSRVPVATAMAVTARRICSKLLYVGIVYYY